MFVWDGEGLLHLEWGLDHCGDETRVNVPLNVAMEQLDAWIVGHEADDRVAVGVDSNGVPLGWDSGEVAALAGVFSFS